MIPPTEMTEYYVSDLAKALSDMTASAERLSITGDNPFACSRQRHKRCVVIKGSAGM